MSFYVNGNAECWHGIKIITSDNLSTLKVTVRSHQPFQILTSLKNRDLVKKLFECDPEDCKIAMEFYNNINKLTMYYHKDLFLDRPDLGLNAYQLVDLCSIILNSKNINKNNILIKTNDNTMIKILEPYCRVYEYSRINAFYTSSKELYYERMV